MTLRAVEKRQYAVVECRGDCSRKARHNERDVESLTDEFLISGDELSDLGRVCLELIDKDEDAMSLLAQFARQLRELELEALSFLHIARELKAG